MLSWFIKRKLKRLFEQQVQYDKGLAHGYKLGFESGQVYAYNRLKGELPLTIANLGNEPTIELITEIEQIMKEKGE